MGQEEGVKDRPCAVVLAVKRDGGETTIVVAPVTHLPPAAGAANLEIPPLTKRRLGLDDKRSWIVPTELNVFAWPGPDIRPVGAGKAFFYGHLPGSLTKQLILEVRKQTALGNTRPVRQT